MNLTEFLTARIVEDEYEAQGPSTWRCEEVGGRVIRWSPIERADVVFAQTDTHIDAVHIARWDPARVLAECEAKRKIVALHQHLPQWPTKTISGDTEFGCDICSRIDDDPGWTHTGGWCETLRAVALPYRDHPDFDSAWA